MPPLCCEHIIHILFPLEKVLQCFCEAHPFPPVKAHDTCVQICIPLCLTLFCRLLTRGTCSVRRPWQWCTWGSSCAARWTSRTPTRSPFKHFYLLWPMHYNSNFNLYLSIRGVCNIIIPILKCYPFALFLKCLMFSLGWSHVWRRTSERLLHVNGYSIYLHLETGKRSFWDEEYLIFCWFIYIYVV